MLFPCKDYDLVYFYIFKDNINNGIGRDKVIIKQMPSFLKMDWIFHN